MPLNIWWIRRDLRLNDNPTLSAALAGAESLLPLFILDPQLVSQPAPRRQAFLFAGLRQLNDDLQAYGSRLLIRAGRPDEVIAQIMQETCAAKIYTEEDYSPYARQRDLKVSAIAPLEQITGLTVHHPAAVLKSDGKPYTVFTPFSKVWKALLFSGSGVKLPACFPQPPTLSGEDIPHIAAPHDFPPGEVEAGNRLADFLQRSVDEYAENRNRLDLEGTSRLSAYFRFGMLSARQAIQQTYTAMRNAGSGAERHGCEVFLNQLIWREFYNAILYHHPYVLRSAFNPGLRRIPWRDAPNELFAWQQGHTGFPIVDACMRQLLATGWMHNRGRMIVASFLVKDLLIDWREGERWFMQQLVDGDPAANNGGWQWTAGTGTDAAPYFRIFNPVLQSKKFDPQGIYIRRWLPELTHVPEIYIHTPWRMPLDIQQAAGCRIGKDYPAPIVDHQLAKERTLTAYKFSKENAGQNS
jgi:deoxyribodipyrimidine photo-lyase